MKATTSEYITVKRQGTIHGVGIIAKKEIPKGTKILEYVGKKITKSEATALLESLEASAEAQNLTPAYYIFELNKKFDIDGDVPWNTARYINHSCNPNCESEDIDGKIWIVAMRDIEKGEELTYDYKFGLDEDDYGNYPCACGATNCVGYIVDQKEWPQLKKILAKKKK